jgi:hypothetical protein
MQSALSNYLSDLDTPSRLTQDVTLATGVLLCSVSVSKDKKSKTFMLLTLLDQFALHLVSPVKRLAWSAPSP